MNEHVFFENRRDEQPSDMITVRRYKPVPLSYRDRLKEEGFIVSKDSVSVWYKKYKGYCIVVKEATNRLKLFAAIKRDYIIPLRGETLVTQEVYTENQLLDTIREYQSKIDRFRSDPYGRSEESMYESTGDLIEELNRAHKLDMCYEKKHLERFTESSEWHKKNGVHNLYSVHLRNDIDPADLRLVDYSENSTILLIYRDLSKPGNPSIEQIFDSPDKIKNLEDAKNLANSLIKEQGYRRLTKSLKNKPMFNNLSSRVRRLSDNLGIDLHVVEPEIDGDAVELFSDSVAEIDGNGLVDVIEVSNGRYVLDTRAIRKYVLELLDTI